MIDISEARNIIDSFVDSECDCDTCKDMCGRPCWPTPSEALTLIDAGYSDKMMLDYWVDDENIYVVCPANPGYGGEDAPSGGIMGMGGALTSGCIMQVDGMCEVHKIKPAEGRKASHGLDHGQLHEAVAATWDTEEGEDVVKRWKLEVGMSDND